VEGRARIGVRPQVLTDGSAAADLHNPREGGALNLNLAVDPHNPLHRRQRQPLAQKAIDGATSCKGTWNGILFEVGTRLHVQHKTFNDNDWYPALVTKVNPGSRTVNIHFSGWDEKYDLISMSVDDKSISLPPKPSKNRDAISIGGVLDQPKLVTKGDVIRAQDCYDKWYDATVLDIDSPNQQVYVTFHGWPHKYDEWIPAISKRLNHDIKPAISTFVGNGAGGRVFAAAKAGESSDWWAKGNSFTLGGTRTRIRAPPARLVDQAVVPPQWDHRVVLQRPASEGAGAGAVDDESRGLQRQGQARQGLTSSSRTVRVPFSFGFEGGQTFCTSGCYPEDPMLAIGLLSAYVRSNSMPSAHSAVCDRVHGQHKCDPTACLPGCTISDTHHRKWRRNHLRVPTKLCQKRPYLCFHRSQ
jgi:hypothetical protein